MSRGKQDKNAAHGYNADLDQKLLHTIVIESNLVIIHASFEIAIFAEIVILLFYWPHPISVQKDPPPLKQWQVLQSSMKTSPAQ